jgi:hypothetical protein
MEDDFFCASLHLKSTHWTSDFVLLPKASKVNVVFLRNMTFSSRTGNIAAMTHQKTSHSPRFPRLSGQTQASLRQATPALGTMWVSWKRHPN